MNVTDQPHFNFGPLLLDQSGEMLLAVAPQTLLIVAANRKTFELLGYTPEELIGLPITEIESSLVDVFYWEGLSQGEGGEVSNVEGLYRRSNGSMLPVMKDVRRLSVQGQDWLLLRVRDERERLRNENAVAELTSQLRATIEATGDGILVTDAYGHVVNMNHRFNSMWGIPEPVRHGGKEAITAWIAAQVADPEAYTRGIKAAALDHREEHVDILKLADNRFFERRSLPQMIGDQVIGRVYSFSDITERKQVEEALRVAATAFESQEGMLVTDANRVILQVNQAFTDITGYSADEVVGRNANLLRSGQQDAAFYVDMSEQLRQQGVWKGELWNQRKNGEIYPEWLTITAVKQGSGDVSHYVGTMTDITLRKAAESEINELAFFDPLTRLPNRRLLMDRLQHALANSARNGREGALLFIDLDDFKTLNDTRGHDVGDQLLQQVAERLVACVREGDTVARFGGDEFVVMLEDLGEKPLEAINQTRLVGEKICAVLNQPYMLGDHQHRSTPSIGAAMFNEQHNSIDELLKRADVAMYQAKAAGRNALRFFDPQMQAAITARATLEADLRQGLQQNQFLLHYQSQVDLAGRITGAEVLLRWHSLQRGLISPVEFIPLAEETGLILPLGEWVLKTACTQLAAWALIPALAHLTLAVNVSARQFHHADFVAQVLAVLDETGADPQKLKLELTESLLLKDIEDIIAKMVALKAKGVGFSLDDFGTGYSSLSYLKRLPLDQLKIDQSFVRDVLCDSNDAVIAKTIIALAQSLGLEVIAEGVETEAQRDFLASSGCQAYQGYFFSRPLPLDGFEQLALGTARVQA
ncbi:MAG: EAL domain-containing protein [Pseudomonadota bacterium]